MSKTRATGAGALVLLGLCLAVLAWAPPDGLARSPRAAGAAESFPLDQVTLLEGPFKQAKDLAVRSLVSFYDPDRMLAGFRAEAGLPPRKPAYGGWEARGIAGHSLGHYLSALSLAAAVTGDARFRTTADHVVRELAAVQAAHGDGYLGAFPHGKRVFEQEIAKGDIRSQGFDLNGLWVPLYTHHKVLAGLRDAYRLTGNRDALQAERRFADWLYGILMPLTDEQMRRVLACEYGGMPEVLADLYQDTRDARYLALARRFARDPVMQPLLESRDSLRGLHANTQIPKMLGMARLHDVAGGWRERKVAEFFWDRVANHHSYATGSNSLGEHFGAPDQLSARLSPVTAETCNVYNMLKLSARLFEWAPWSGQADYMERAMLNHSLASQHPATGHVLYFLSLAMGGRKTFDDPHAFTCCVGSGMEHHLLYGRYLYFHDADGLYVNQFAGSEVRWPEKGATLRQETRFPDEERTRLTWTVERPVAIDLRVRVPRWAERGVQVRVNGAAVAVRQLPTGYVAVRRTWRTGDRVDVELPFTLRLEPMPDDPDRVAVFHGPLVLAGELGPLDDARATAFDYVPVLITGGRPVDAWLAPVAGAPNTFRTTGVGEPRDVTLKPFFRVHDRRYTVYWDLFTPAGWKARRAEYEAERRAMERLERRTVDAMQPGEMQPERDHEFRGDRSEAGEVFGRKFRHAFPGGWFSYELKVLPEHPVELIATYWGDESTERVFDVQVDGRTIATQRLLHDRGPQFIQVAYPIPPELTRGRSRVTVRFQTHPERMAGGLFGLRVARQDADTLR